MKTPGASLLTLTLAAGLAYGQRGPADRNTDRPTRTPDRGGIQDTAGADRTPRGPDADPPAQFPRAIRRIDGAGNNLQNPDLGAALSVFRRVLTASYADGVAEPAGADRPSAREISNACAAQGEDMPNARGVTDYFWQWGQFLDHDIVLTPTADPAEPFDIAVPSGDPHFDPAGTGTQTIPMDRSFHVDESGVREQANDITAWIDGSQVYGSDDGRATALRRMDGSGKLKTSDGNLLPFNEDGLPNAPTADSFFFLAGDFRANEQAGLLAMHTLFMREHNHWADVASASMPHLSGDERYEFARAIVAAEIQIITYTEFLPLLLGRDAMPEYRGYRSDVDAGIGNAFATAAYRFGHSMLSPTLLRLNAQGEEIDEGHIALADAFFSPGTITSVGIDPYLRGLCGQYAQELDSRVVDDVRNLLFGPPGSGGFDLASLNIQRGRDHGLPSYAQARIDLGLQAIAKFGDIPTSSAARGDLEAVYADVEQIDLWVGGLCETPERDAMVGPTFHRILRDQFQRLRDGDRFWYRSYLPGAMRELVEGVRLSDVIRRNTGIGTEIPNHVFVGANADTDDQGPRSDGPRDRRR